MATYVVRTLKDGSRRIKVMVRRTNAPTATRTFASKREAEAWALQIDGQIARGQRSSDVEATRHTVADAIDRYKETVFSQKSRQPKDVLSQLEFWKAKLGSVKLSELTPFLICRIRDELARGTTVQGKRRQPATVNRRLSAFGPVLTAAVKDWGWMPESPMSRVRKLKEPRGRVRYLSDTERSALLSECAKSMDPHLYAIVLLAISTGMRRGEIVGLRWIDIDWERRRITLLHTKNGERRAVPLVPRVFDLLAERSRHVADKGELVFPSPKRGYEGRAWDFGRAWEKALTQAKIGDFRFHDLRHSCASYLAMNGATTAEIAEVLGHKTLQMVKRYAHLTDSHVAGIVTRMSERFLSTTSIRAEGQANVGD